MTVMQYVNHKACNLSEIMHIDASIFKEAVNNELKNYQREFEKHERRKKPSCDQLQNPNEPMQDACAEAKEEEKEKKKYKPKICDIPSYRIKMARIEKIRQNDRTGILTLISILKSSREKDSAMFRHGKA